MQRRDLIERIGAASALGATGLAAAVQGRRPDGGSLTHARVENERGELETVSLSELEVRGDLPSTAALRPATDSISGESCCCNSCTDCICCIC